MKLLESRKIRFVLFVYDLLWPCPPRRLTRLVVRIKTTTCLWNGKINRRMWRDMRNGEYPSVLSL
ncbi:hypothetical protein L6270_01805 [Candidatus Parcubacteria bacterium]|nr:hypothetical protein [Patescibacteria group bacterium]MBU4309872.1 hypothetical protein [Patescibacteria group bacterium]MBU4431717.1 hypothetical protein [Patescibacteria group bacterium]MBU4578211.1 hypothetical protein [Patescibacteria group bacterium]MCG2696747.1 hypothetical protein [Candidatus Parcubacteria bacterium]